jgi:hypothetical protein
MFNPLKPKIIIKANPQNIPKNVKIFSRYPVVFMTKKQYVDECSLPLS